MATYYVWSGATGTNAGTSWTNAYTAFGSAVTAATASGDVILVHYTHQENLAIATTYTFGNNVNIISVNKDSSDAPTAMGTGGWVGHGGGSNSVDVILNGAFKVSLFGMTFRTSGSDVNNLDFATSDGSHFEFDNCYIWQGCSSASANINVGSSSSTAANGFAKFTNSTFRFGNISQSLRVGQCRALFEYCTIASAGSAPTTLFDSSGRGGPTVEFLGCNLSYVTGTLVASMSAVPGSVVFSQCKLGANVTILATQTPANKSSGAAYVFDCSSGDTHTFMGYYDAFGSCVSDTGIYYTTGAAAQSWKIVTTANCSYYTPFVSPFVDFYNTGTTSITPRFEILRDGSTTAFQDDEVWGEFFVKSTSGSTQSTPSSDRMALLGTPANQATGAGTGSWTGEAASAWSGKIDSGVAVTPAEVGAIRGRVVVGEPSITVYVDPQVRT